MNANPIDIKNSLDIFDKALENKSPNTDDFLLVSHDIHNTTANELVEHMLQSIKERGYKAVTVGECLGDLRENWYRVDNTSLSP